MIPTIAATGVALAPVSVTRATAMRPMGLVRRADSVLQYGRNDSRRFLGLPAVRCARSSRGSAANPGQSWILRLVMWYH